MFRIITWNIACLPKKLNMLRDPISKIDQILEKIHSLDATVICIQEVFDYTIQRKIINFLREKNYEIHISKDDGYYIPKNGLLTASKYPIIRKDELDYNKSVGLEKWVNKGIITIYIDHPELKEIAIHNTHLQSDSKFWIRRLSRKCRMNQYDCIKEYLQLYNVKCDVMIVLGDLNDDYDFVMDYSKNELGMKTMNEEKLITFPTLNQQLDYIMCNKKNVKMEFKVIDGISDDMSDHHILLGIVEEYGNQKIGIVPIPNPTLRGDP